MASSPKEFLRCCSPISSFAKTENVKVEAGFETGLVYDVLSWKSCKKIYWAIWVSGLKKEEGTEEVNWWNEVWEILCGKASNTFTNGNISETLTTLLFSSKILWEFKFGIKLISPENHQWEPEWHQWCTYRSLRTTGSHWYCSNAVFTWCKRKGCCRSNCWRWRWNSLNHCREKKDQWVTESNVCGQTV